MELTTNEMFVCWGGGGGEGGEYIRILQSLRGIR